MSTRPYKKKFFNFHSDLKEQKLLEDIHNEALHQQGLNGIYIVRDSHVDLLYGEDPLAKFTNWFEICFYINDVELYSTNNLFEKFGLKIDETLSLLVAKRDFTEITRNELEPNRPRQGDIIYFPVGFSNGLFTIKEVNDEYVPYQLGQLYVYELKCKFFSYSNEKIETGFGEIDEIGDSLEQTIELNLSSGTGTFLKGEMIYQGTNFANATFMATIKDIVEGENTLLIKRSIGNVDYSSPIIGNSSLAEWSFAYEDLSIQNDPKQLGDHIETKADQLLIKTTRNRFDRGNP